jgi:hypothetical protein
MASSAPRSGKGCCSLNASPRDSQRSLNWFLSSFTTEGRAHLGQGAGVADTATMDDPLKLDGVLGRD